MYAGNYFFMRSAGENFPFHAANAAWCLRIITRYNRAGARGSEGGGGWNLGLKPPLALPTYVGKDWGWGGAFGLVVFLCLVYLTLPVPMGIGTPSRTSPGQVPPKRVREKEIQPPAIVRTRGGAVFNRALETSFKRPMILQMLWGHGISNPALGGQDYSRRLSD
jgi:hypothetical protein